MALSGLPGVSWLFRLYLQPTFKKVTTWALVIRSRDWVVVKPVTREGFSAGLSERENICVKARGGGWMYVRSLPVCTSAERITERGIYK